MWAILMILSGPEIRFFITVNPSPFPFVPLLFPLPYFLPPSPPSLHGTEWPILC